MTAQRSPAPRPPVMPLSITSEIGRLKSALVHLPGDEIDRMLPSMMGELLFDDILFGESAREEHRRLKSLIELVADEVLEFQELLTEVFREPGARDTALADLETKLGLSKEVIERL